VLIDKFDGKPLNSPNDIVVKSDDSIWFSDPAAPGFDPWEGRVEPPVLPTNVYRLDPKTGRTVQYLMPSDTNMRTVFVDNSTTPVTFWVGSNHDHRIVKVEPLD